MWCGAIVVVSIVLIALILGARPLAGARGQREKYGPPPGAYRALSHEELGDRGWPSYPFEYNANTASAISHMIERSA